MTQENKAVEKGAATLIEKVASFKVIAREALRMELVAPRLSKIASLEAEIKGRNEEIKSYDHRIAVNTYENSKLDTNHPDYEDNKKEKEAALEYLAKIKEETTKEINEIKKEIEEQNDSINKIASGETKVSIDSLNELVSKMIRQSALDQVSA
jgi:chromosome segregation ATPase